MLAHYSIDIPTPVNDEYMVPDNKNNVLSSGENAQQIIILSCRARIGGRKGRRRIQFVQCYTNVEPVERV
jgi:hypothetical protein